MTGTRCSWMLPWMQAVSLQLLTCGTLTLSRTRLGICLRKCLMVLRLLPVAIILRLPCLSMWSAMWCTATELLIMVISGCWCGLGVGVALNGISLLSVLLALMRFGIVLVSVVLRVCLIVFRLCSDSV